MDSKSLEAFHVLRTKTEEAYKKVDRLHCPALKSTITFHSDGFHHLRFDKNRSERKKEIQRTKFLLFPKAVDILKKTTTIQEYRRGHQTSGKKDQNGFRKIQQVEWFGFFAVTSFSNPSRVKVIVRRVGGEQGQFYFWSVIPNWRLSNGMKMVGSEELIDG